MDTLEIKEKPLFVFCCNKNCFGREKISQAHFSVEAALSGCLDLLSASPRAPFFSALARSSLSQMERDQMLYFGGMQGEDDASSRADIYEYCTAERRTVEEVRGDLCKVYVTCSLDFYSKDLELRSRFYKIFLIYSHH